MDREALGRLVRETWVRWASEQPDPRPSWLVPWEDLGEGQREVDMRIGEAVAGASRSLDDREAQREHYRQMFALQRQAKEMGRGITSGGDGWRGSFYGAVIATYPEGSRIARQDSWRCHHKHPDDLGALACALAETRRLAAGGSYAPCSAGPACGDRQCRRDWERAALREEATDG